MANTKNRIIMREKRLVYNSLAHIPHIELCNINRGIEVGIERVSTSLTLDETSMPDSINIMTSTASLGSVSGININNSNTLHQRFIFDKALELPESPLVDPYVIFGTLSDSRQVFHNNGISFIQTINDSLTDIVIFPTHQPSPLPTHFLEFSLGSSGAFALELTHKFIMPDSFLLDIFSVEPPFTTYNESINADVKPQNSLCLRALRLNTSECEQEESPIKLVDHQKTFTNLPIFEIDFETIRNRKGNLNSTFKSGNTQDTILNGSRTGEVVTNRNIIDERFSFGFLDHPTGLFDAPNRQLRGQTQLSQIIIDKGMEFNIIPNSHFPSPVNTQLQSSFVDFNSINNLRSCFNFNFGRCSQTHRLLRNSNYLNISEDSFSSPMQDKGVSEAMIE